MSDMKTEFKHVSVAKDVLAGTAGAVIGGGTAALAVLFGASLGGVPGALLALAVTGKTITGATRETYTAVRSRLG